MSIEVQRDVLKRNIGSVMERIEEARRRAGRNDERTTLVAVTKTVPAEVAAAAWELGLRHFGENRVEEGLPKIEQVRRLLAGIDAQDAPPTWHMVGHVQSRKARDVVRAFHVVQSVDRVKIVRELEKRAAAIETTITCLVEINTSGEASKYGIPGTAGPDNQAQAQSVIAVAEALVEAPHLRPEGLMTMGPLSGSPQEVRRCFALLRRWRICLQQRLPEATWRHLSMGMTDDFEIGIEEGATIVRIGRGIFQGTFQNL